MPQASDSDRAHYRRLFPDLGCEHAMKALQGAGFTLRKDWTWERPSGRYPTEQELFLIHFLIAEWDFGGLREERR
jgi:hypothetical protein